MAFLGSFGTKVVSAVKSVVSSVGNIVKAGPVSIARSLNPVAEVQVIAKAVNIPISPSVTKTMETAKSYIATAQIAGASLLIPGVAPAVASTASKLGIIKTAAVTGGAIIGGNALIASPKLRNEVVNLPSNLANFGTNVGRIVENPSVDTVTNTFKENPVISGLVVAGGSYAVGKGITTAWTSLLNTRATQDAAKATREATDAANKLKNDVITPPQPPPQPPPPAKDKPKEDKPIILDTSPAPAVVAPQTTAPAVAKKKVAKKKKKKVYKAPKKKKKAVKKKKYIKKKPVKKKKKVKK